MGMVKATADIKMFLIKGINEKRVKRDMELTVRRISQTDSDG